MGLPVDELVARLRYSVGPAVFEDGLQLPNPPDERESWIELQSDAVAAAERAAPEERAELAAALLDAILRQPSFGPSNRLDEPAFALSLEAVPERLERSLGERSVETMYGGQRYLRWYLWQLPGRAGADWLRRLAEAGDIAANFLFQDMCAGKIAPWRDADWAARLDVLATLPDEPRPGIVGMLFLGRPSVEASPSLTRVVMAHAVDERDVVLRWAADHIRELRAETVEADVALFDWGAGLDRPGLFRWFLELAGEPGRRAALVEAAVALGRATPEDGRVLAATLDRPAWADGPVPWSIDTLERAGVVRVPKGKLTGGDPWWTGGAEGLPWIVDLPPGAYETAVVVASHPLSGRHCAALHLRVTDAAAVAWLLVTTVRGEPGYTVEAGVAGLGAVGAYDPPRIHHEPASDEWIAASRPWWRELDAGDAGSLVGCSVGPQHQECRTWIGLDSENHVAGVVTDLGLLGLDLEADPRLPWDLTAKR